MQVQYKSGCLKKNQKLIFGFFIPFFVVSTLWTIIDYCDISDGIEKERDIGINHKVTDADILFNSLKGSILFALPAGLIGLAAASVIFKKGASTEDSRD